jgi:hypothetical protein
MEIKGDINSLSSFLFEFAVQIILIPKTFFKIFLKPTWIISYFNERGLEELETEHEKFSNPVLFWIATGVLPFYFITDFYFQGYTKGKVLATYNEINSFSIISGFTIFLVSIPLSCAFIQQIFKYKVFSKKTFKRCFYIQLYLTAPLLLFFYFPMLFIDVLSEDLCIAELLIISITIWFLIAELKVIKKDLSFNSFVSFLILVIMYFTSFLFCGICMVIFFLINIGNFQKLIEAYFP